MSKKMYFLVSFVLLLGLGGAAQAEPIEVNNPSFEYDINGVEITEQTYIGDLQGWTIRDTTEWAAGWLFAHNDWVWIEGDEAADGNVCIFNVTYDEPNDVNYSCQLYQLLDPNFDANAVIEENRRYTLTFNALRMVAEDNPSVYGALFYSQGGVNVPRVNDVMLASKEVYLTAAPWGPDYEGWEEITMTYTSLPGEDSIGKRLGIKLSVPAHDPWFNGYQVVYDNVHLEWSWAADAWNPIPADGAGEVPIDATLSWRPGVWVQSTGGHEVYFGTSYSEVDSATTSTSGVFQGAQDSNTWSVLDYAPSGLDLGKTYYWRIDEVNESYSGTSPPPPPDGRWKGQVWSFGTEGRAKNPTPEDGAIDIPFIDLTLSWEAGRDALTHDVYFGNNYDNVNDANTSSPEFIHNQGGLSYYVPESSETSGGLDAGRTYCWRIDEHTASEIITGHVWSFTIGEFLVVDDMESYDTTTNYISETWQDWYYNDSGAEVSLTYNDPNHMRAPGSQSMQLDYYNPKSGSSCDSSYIDANPADLLLGTDWTVGGVKSITLFWLGDEDNVIPGPPTDYNAVRLWMELEDTSNNSYLAKYGDLGDWPGNIQVAQWHQWDISLEDFINAGVDLSSLERVTIGIGGTAYTGQTKGSEGTIWIDDIRVYPPRCFPERAQVVGNLDSDCYVGIFDLEIMANEWLKSGVWVEASAPADPPELWYRFDEGSGSTVVKNDGSWGSQYNILVSGAGDEPVWTTDVAPVLDPCDPNYALYFDGSDDYLEVPNSPATNFAGTENMTITTWVKGVASSWTHLVVSAKVPEGDDRHATGLGFGGSSGQFMYFWNNNEWWWDPGFVIPDNEWTFMAITVEPTKATAYVYDGNDFGLAINEVEHGILKDFDTGCFTVLAQDAKDSGYFDGIMDDVRLYNRTLTTDEIMGLAGVEGYLYLPLDSVADMVVGIQNPTDPNAPIDDQVDFRDYAILADNWLTEQLWP